MKTPLRLIAARIVTDFAVGSLAVVVSYWIRYSLNPGHIKPTGGEAPDLHHYLPAAPAVGLLLVVVFAAMGAYRYRRGLQYIDELFATLGALIVTAVVVLAAMGLYREPSFEFSRLVFVDWVVVAGVLLALARYALRRLQARGRKRGVGADRALVVGWGAAADLLVQRIRMFPDYGYQLVGILADGLRPVEELAGVQVLGHVDELPAVVGKGGVDVVFMALSDVSSERLLTLMESCEETGVEFRIVPSMLEIMTTQVTADHLDGIPLLQFRRGLDIDRPSRAFKRAFDVVCAALGLVLLSPLLGLIALLVKLTSPGPVLVHQERVGLEGRVFRMHKFRSMRVDAERATGPVWASPGDPRRTGVGRVIRRLSFDELPQLWNILRGEMSMVGPRAERPNFVREFLGRLDRYQDRLRVRPGLAGWAQANDLRGQTPVEERLIYDLYYIENWSLAFDLKILLITLFRVWTHKNAY
ncbi:MAG TPA: undecaprenyl-phosphate glucose phosphotransferase [Candidatus Dormibacteraeota bacterium]